MRNEFGDRELQCQLSWFLGRENTDPITVIPPALWDSLVGMVRQGTFSLPLVEISR